MEQVNGFFTRTTTSRTESDGTVVTTVSESFSSSWPAPSEATDAWIEGETYETEETCPQIEEGSSASEIGSTEESGPGGPAV